MLNNVLSVLTGDAALYALIGFFVVFGGISFLICIVWLIGKGLSYFKGVPAGAQPKQVKVHKEVPTTAAQAIAVADAEVVDEETVAVITAALMAYYKQAKPECGFIVKRIKRI